MIDIHSHFLPGMDDGCRDVQESLTCLHRMRASGYRQIMCTPHFASDEFRQYSFPQISERVQELQFIIHQNNVGIELKPGGEVRLTPDLPERFERLGVPAVGKDKDRFILCDIWERIWEPWATAQVEWLQGQGYQVLLAHPERMPSVQANPDLVDDFVRMGMLLQGNLNPLGRGDSHVANLLAERFLKDGRYFALGSDTHRSDRMDQRLHGLAHAIDWVGFKMVKQLTQTNPARLWG